MIKLNLKNQFSIFFKILFFSLFFISKSLSDNISDKKKMIVLGSYNAAVKIKIFSSLTCPHCANFHKEVVPKLKKKYVESGKVQLIFMDFPLDLAAFNASKFLHCVDQKKQINLLDAIYENQNKWTNGSNIDEINNNLKKIGKNLGISSAQFDKCLMDEVISDNILNERIDAAKKYSIEATPTIIINEKKLEGSINFKNIEKKIEKII
tara:strand:- start:797 stop:1420 length:624 start_codon:yes stop_codon:yes gene_type:complete